MSRFLSLAAVAGALLACGGDDGPAGMEGSAGSGPENSESHESKQSPTEDDDVASDDVENGGGSDSSMGRRTGSADEDSADEGSDDIASGEAEAGEEAGPCYPNATCNEGLTCASDLCVDLGGENESDGSGTMSDSDGEPVCRTIDLINAAAGEKTNAAFCFSIAYGDDYACAFDAARNATICLGTAGDYIVGWAGAAFGEVYDVEGNYMADIQQGETGAFQIFWADGAIGLCSVIGDVATLCVQP